LVDTPEQLQQWASEQPEMPTFRFLTTGSSVVYTPPADLIFNKLLLNPMFKDTLRFDTPYNKTQMMPMWILVRFTLRLLLSCACVSPVCLAMNMIGITKWINIFNYNF